MTIREVTLMTGRGGYGKVGGGGYRFLDPQKGGFQIFLYGEGEVTDFSGNVLRLKSMSEGILVKQIQKNFGASRLKT